MHSNSPLVKCCLKIADTKGLELSLDTHYDANNCEFSWWIGNTKHRIDFQPTESNTITVTYYRDKYPFFGRFFRWAHYTIPMFPYVATRTFDTIGVFSESLTEADIVSILRNAAA